MIAFVLSLVAGGCEKQDVKGFFKDLHFLSVSEWTQQVFVGTIGTALTNFDRQTLPIPLCNVL